MRGPGATRVASIIVSAVAAAWAAAGCAWTAATPAAPREGAVFVTPVERVRWDLPPERGIFRVRFGAGLSASLRREAEQMTSAESVDYVHAEIRVLEREAERELRARRLCGGNVRILLPLEPGADGPELGALFRCTASLF